MYLHDPDFNGIERAWDRDLIYWRLVLEMTLEPVQTVNIPLDFDSLLSELADADVATYLPVLRTYR